MSKKPMVVVGTFLGLGLLFFALVSRGAFQGSVSQLNIDLGRPDVLIQSASIAKLPRDLVALPGLRDVLTADFVNYYEEHPERLSLEGSLRRIAFEHGLTWQDRVLSAVLDAPAHLALWRDGKGRLAYAALSLEKNVAARAVEQLGNVVLPDSQLSHAGEISLEGQPTKVLVLRINAKSSWLLISSKARLLVLTHPGMLLGADKRLASGSVETIQALLAGKGNPWLADAALADLAPKTKHAITAKMSWLSLGYQHFFPDLHALRLDMGEGATWSLSVATEASVWPNWTKAAASAWGVLPRGGSLCAALPVKWEGLHAVFETALGSDKSKALTADLEAGAAVCWYSSQGLYAPSLAMRFKRGVGGKHDASLQLLIEKSMKAGKDKPAISAVQKLVQGHPVWSANVPGPYGYFKAGGENAHRVSLLRRGDSLIASLDHRAIDQALSVAAKGYPALADEVGPVEDAQAPLLISDLPEMGRLLQAESLRLTQSTPAFQTLVRTRLKPRLDGMGRHGILTLSAAQPRAAPVADSGKLTWTWQALVLATETPSRAGATPSAQPAAPTSVAR